MDTEVDYPINQAIADTAHALSSHLGLDSKTVKRILSPWILRSVPKEEYRDVLQDLACRALQVRPQTPGLLYRVFKFYIADWWKARQYRQHESLDVPVGDDEDEGTPLVEILPDNSRLVDELVCNLISAREVLRQVPVQVVHIAAKRQFGSPLTVAERQRLSRWRRSHGLQLRLTSN